ncbi:MAG: hypothetical protein K0R69_1812 [Clostridia bacterium]|nr:hypothetical protein [Clostridia bacterium]
MINKYVFLIVGDTIGIIGKFGGLSMKCKYCKQTIKSHQKICHKCGKLVRFPLYRTGWVWVFPLLFAFAVLGLLTSHASRIKSFFYNPIHYTSTNNPPSFLSQTSLLEVLLPSGSFLVGKDIKPGRYMITTPKGMGDLFIYKKDIPYINEILTYAHNEDSTIGVTKIETNLSAGDRIQISGLEAALFAPVPVFKKTTLVSGHHLVGRDIPAGDYTVIAPSGTGHFMIYDPQSSSSVDENLIPHSPNDPHTQLEVSLKEGQIVRINNLDRVELTK